jgi:hypothetical protein
MTSSCGSQSDLTALLASVGVPDASLAAISDSLWMDEIEPRFRQWELLE